MLKEKVKELQVKEGLSDYKFASKLGVSHQLWQMTRTDKRDIGLVLLKAIVKAYPRLNWDVLIFLGADWLSVTTKSSAVPPETAHNQFLGGLYKWLKGFIVNHH